MTKVLFVCTHNSNRSIAAEAVARKLRPDLHVASAGVASAGTINPLMANALAARDFSTEGMRSKSVEDAEIGGLSNDWDYIIMMGCLSKGLPTEPPKKTKVEDWGLPDPAANPSIINEVIDKIIEKVKAL